MINERVVSSTASVRRVAVGALLGVVALVANVGCVPDTPPVAVHRIDGVSPRLVPIGGSMTLVVEGVGLAGPSGADASAGLSVSAVRPISATVVEVDVTDVGADPTAPLDVSLSFPDGQAANCIGCVRVVGEVFEADPGSALAVDEGVRSSVLLAGTDGGLGRMPTTGDVLSLGEGPTTGDGIFARVLGAKEENENLRVTFERISIVDGIPQGVINVSGELVDPDVGAVPGAGLRAGSILRPLAAEVTCADGAELELSGTASIAPDFDFALEWGNLFNPITRASIEVSATETLAITATASASASCELEETDLLPKPIRFAAIPVPGLPIQVIPTLQFYASGNAAADGSISAGLTQEFTATAGLTYDRGTLTPAADHTNSFEPDVPTATVTGSVGVRVGARISFLLGGVVGPEVNLDGTLDLSTTVLPNACTTLTGGLHAGATIAVPLLDFRKGDPAIISTTSQLVNDCDWSGWTGSYATDYSKTIAQTGNGVLQEAKSTTFTVTPDGSATWHYSYYVKRRGPGCVIQELYDEGNGTLPAPDGEHFAVDALEDGTVTGIRVLTPVAALPITGRIVTTDCDGNIFPGGLPGPSYPVTFAPTYLTTNASCEPPTFGSVDENGDGHLTGTATCDLPNATSTASETLDWDLRHPAP